MAYVKTFPIRYHVKTAIEYIGNPLKTDNGRLTYTYNCSFESADLEFKQTRRRTSHKGNQAARHIVQSFKPNEITPEEAMEIGKQLADELFGGKFEYVIATHVDTKAVHNHIIVNSVSFKDLHKLRSNKRTYHEMRNISDRICAEHGLSVIQNPKAHSYRPAKEVYAELGNNRVVWRDILRFDIDNAIQNATDYEDFLNRMYHMGYGIKTGKHLAFKNKNQQRYMRVKSLGRDYTEADIRERIITKRPAIPKSFTKNNRNISLLINIGENIKCQTSKGYENWAKLYNLQEAAKTLNFLIENNIASYDELNKKIEDLYTKKQQTVTELRQLNQQMHDMKERINVIESYESVKPVALGYNDAVFKSKYKQKYSEELRMFEAMKTRLNWLYPDGKIPKISRLESEYKNISNKQNSLYITYKSVEDDVQMYSVMQKNIEQFLGRTQERTRKTPTLDQSL